MFSSNSKSTTFMQRQNTRPIRLRTANTIPIEIQKNIPSLKSGDDIYKEASKSYYMERLLNALFIDQRQNDLFKLYKPILNTEKDKKTLPELRLLKKKDEVYIILEYTKIGGGPKFCNMGFPGKPATNGAPDFDYLDTCLYKNCMFTCDKSQLNEADALLMHLTDVFSELISVPEALDELTKTRRPDQTWILWNDEANFVETHFDQLRFNWTLSYKIESEASYGTYGFYAPSTEKIENFDVFVKQNFDRRSSNSVWFVSNCASDLRNKFTLGLSVNSAVIL